MKIIAGMAAALLCLCSTATHATEYRKETTLQGLEAHSTTRPMNPGTQNREFLTLPSGVSWILHGGSGGGTCSETVAVLPENSAVLRAVALSAIASGAAVTIIVDSNLMVSGVCQITVLGIKSS